MPRRIIHPFALSSTQQRDHFQDLADRRGRTADYDLSSQALVDPALVEQMPKGKDALVPKTAWAIQFVRKRVVCHSDGGDMAENDTAFDSPSTKGKRGKGAKGDGKGRGGADKDKAADEPAAKSFVWTQVVLLCQPESHGGLNVGMPLTELIRLNRRDIFDTYVDVTFSHNGKTLDKDGQREAKQVRRYVDKCLAGEATAMDAGLGQGPISPRGCRPTSTGPPL